MESILLIFIEKYSYVSVFLLILIENIFPPIPSEIVLTFSGYIVSKYRLNIFLMIVSSTLGSIIGSEILYYLGKRINLEQLKMILKKFHFKIDKIDMSYHWFEKYGIFTVFICRFIPLIRSLISIPAGISKMNHIIFIIYTSLGSLIWNSVLTLFGYIFENNYHSIEVYLKQYTFIIILLLIIFVISIKKKK